MSDHSTRALARHVLEVKLPDNASGAFTVRGYFMKLLHALWDDQGVSSGRLFGSSAWHFDLYEALVREGLVAGAFDEDGYLDEFTDEARDQADHLIHLAIQELGRSG